MSKHSYSYAGSTVEFEDNSKEILEALHKAGIRGLSAIGETAVDYAQDDCPVDTGRLKNSITYTVDDSQEAVFIGTNVEYAPYVELGTYKQKAKPFLRPAAQDHGAEYRELMNKSLENA